MRKRVYRKIFEDYHGIKIPKGYHIHHKDGDSNNNSIDNLEMLTPDEHARKHGFLNNFIMAQEAAAKLAVEKLRTPEIREKMSIAMKNSDAHKKGIQLRSKNKEWYKNVSKACAITAKNRTNDPWNKGRKGDKLSEETKMKMSEGRVGRKWFNDGVKSYFIFPNQAAPHLVLGRK